MSTGQKPTKGVKPQFEGVPGTLLSARDVEPLGLIFGATTRRSPYDARLRDLCAAEAGSVLCFGDTRARASLYQRAKKLNIKLEFGEHAGKLYARLGAIIIPQAEPPKSVSESVVSDQKTRTRALILTAIREGARTPEAMAASIRKEGGPQYIDGAIVRGLLKNMQTAGTVRLTKISPETWELAQ